jgi:hypothetical protein
MGQTKPPRTSESVLNVKHVFGNNTLWNASDKNIKLLQKEYALMFIFNKIQTSLEAANRLILSDRRNDHAWKKLTSLNPLNAELNHICTGVPISPYPKQEGNGSRGTCNPEETGLSGLPVSWSPTLFSGSGPVGLLPVPWTEKNIWKWSRSC